MTNQQDTSVRRGSYADHAQEFPEQYDMPKIKVTCRCGRSFEQEDSTAVRIKLALSNARLLDALELIADGQDDPAWMRCKAREALAAAR